MPQKTVSDTMMHVTLNVINGVVHGGFGPHELQLF